MEPTPLEGKYNITKLLHKNETTVVNEVTEKSGGGKFVSKRVLKTSESNIVKLYWEVTLLEAMDHRNVVKLYHCDENEHYVFMIFEKMDGDLLSFVERIKSVPESKAIPIITQILEGVEFLHNQSILHRDLKVDNILFDKLEDGTIRIAISDFGFAIRTSKPIVEPLGNCTGRRLLISLGTPFYAAPEIFNSAYGKSVDVWAVGIMSYAILTGDFPFHDDDNKKLIYKIHNNPVVWPIFPNISDVAKDFVESLLQKEPAKRVSVKQALNHTFITS